MRINKQLDELLAPLPPGRDRVIQSKCTLVDLSKTKVCIVFSSTFADSQSRERYSRRVVSILVSSSSRPFRDVAASCVAAINKSSGKGIYLNCRKVAYFVRYILSVVMKLLWANPTGRVICRMQIAIIR